LLKAKGLHVVAVQNPLTSLAGAERGRVTTATALGHPYAADDLRDIYADLLATRPLDRRSLDAR
jgi:hypothetical protein